MSVEKRRRRTTRATCPCCGCVLELVAVDDQDRPGPTPWPMIQTRSNTPPATGPADRGARRRRSMKIARRAGMRRQR